MESLLSTPYVVDWRIARVLGMLELKEFIGEAQWEDNAVLSKYPVVVFDAMTDSPKYYEFHVLDSNGNSKGIITCVADKRMGEPIALVMSDMKQDLRQASSASRFVSSGQRTMSVDTRVYDVGYPFVMQESASSVRAAVARNAGEEKTPQELLDEWLDSLPDEELQKAGKSREPLRVQYLAEATEEEMRISSLWEKIDGAYDEMLAVTDEDIAAAYEQNSRSASHFTKSYYVQPWASLNYRPLLEGLTIYCAPAVVAEIAYGYKIQQGIPVVALSLGIQVKEHMGDGAKYYVNIFSPGLTSSLKKFTDGKLDLGYHLGHIWNHIYEELRIHDLPVISLRTGVGIFTAWHYRIIIGAAERETKIQHRFLWIRWTEYKQDRYYYMADNGMDAGGREWESVFGETLTTRHTLKFWEKHQWFGAQLVNTGVYFQHFSVET
ncbi:hypothetical protein [Parasphaerochaeta coccoides]|uniref:hypothetical protein n=1 Tax=Parasphaerochaeta coccoides TaxID=273376 RepID=UPI0011D24130|nr:hypothetical protein [Parasphaerochaeta coccoides]